MVIHTDGGEHRFRITEVTDDLGFFADDGQYVDVKSWFLFSQGNPIFSGDLERSLGDYGVVRKRNGGIPQTDDLDALRPHYRVVNLGWQMGGWQQEEIDRDFLIFDFILAMTVVLAAVGVTNAILIQVHARERELSVLRMVGVSRGQTTRLLLVEGAVIGIASALLALVLGHALGAISVAFLDRFTLFDYQFVFSPGAGALISLLAVATCCLSAIYPSIVANRISSAESLHYE
jgi:putative ABC transport system permease protein